MINHCIQYDAYERSFGVISFAISNNNNIYIYIGINYLNRYTRIMMKTFSLVENVYTVEK